MDIPVTTPTSTLLNYTRMHVEISSKCTLKCPRCPRTELDPAGLNQDITLAEFQRAFDLELLKEIQEIIFCGDIGDPIYARDFLEIVRYIKTNSQVSLRIVTNGSYKSTEWWTELGAVLRNNDTVTFSIDGWDQASNEQYRVNSDFKSIIAGARALRKSSKCLMKWSAIYFKFNEQHMADIRLFAKDLGFDMFQTVRSSKFDGRYAVDGVDKLKPLGGWYSKTVQYETDVENLTNQVPVVFYNTRDRHAWARCVNWQKEMFVSVEGLVFPCPWFNSGYQENDFVEKYRDRLSIKTRTLKEILADPLWDELLTRFEIAPLEICKIKCRDCK
jgi:MoaA/NifB/PqqE/SkfB family radical SAM enzyme